MFFFFLKNNNLNLSGKIQQIRKHMQNKTTTNQENKRKHQKTPGNCQRYFQHFLIFSYAFLQWRRRIKNGTFRCESLGIFKTFREFLRIVWEFSCFFKHFRGKQEQYSFTVLQGRKNAVLQFYRDGKYQLKNCLCGPRGASGRLGGPGVGFPGNFREISGKIPGKFRENSGKFPGIFREISQEIPGNFPEIFRAVASSFTVLAGK